MSYIKHRERVFLKKGRNVVKKRSDGNLRKIASCNDMRAWSLSAEDQRQFFIDSVTSSSVPSLGKYVPPGVIVDILLKQNNYFKKFNSLKKSSSEELVKKKSKENLVTKKRRTSVNQPKEEKYDQGDKEQMEEESVELSNLRTLVDDLEMQLSVVGALQEENSKLKAQLIEQKSENLDELGREAYKENGVSPVNQTGQFHDGTIHKIRAECSKMKSEVEYLQSKNHKLTTKLKKTSSNEMELKNREVSMSLESVNNAILRSKITGKQMKIDKLVNMNEEQKANIEGLVCQIKEMAIAFSWKEEMLTGKLIEFKNIVGSSMEKVLKYETKLCLCQDLIRGMEVLSDHFRLVNSSLKENVVYYKRQFKTVAFKALEMACKIDCLLREISVRDTKIKDLSKFPGRSCVAIRLAQLDEILKGDFLFDRNRNSAVKTFERLRNILIELRKEAWENYGFEGPTSFGENFSQTAIDSSDSGIQHDLDASEKEVQTDSPDEYVLKYIAAGLIIRVFNNLVKRLKKSLKKEKQSNDNLHKELDHYASKIAYNENEIDDIKRQNFNLENDVHLLKSKIEQSKTTMSTVVSNSEYSVNMFDSLNMLYDRSLKSTVGDYEEFCDLLEDYIELGEKKIDELTSYIQNDVNDQKWVLICKVCDLEKSLVLVKETLLDEIRINNMLNKEVDIIKEDLSLRDDMIDKVEGLWLNAELENEKLKKENDKLLSIENSVNFSESIENNESSVELDDPLNDPSDQLSTDVLTTEQSIVTQVSSERFSSVMVMTDESNYSIDRVDQSTETIESQIETSLSNCRKLKRIIRNNNLEEKKLKTKMCQVNMKVKRIRICIINLRNKLDISVTALQKLKETNVDLTESNRSLSSANLNSRNKNVKLKEIISQLKLDVKSETCKNIELQIKQKEILRRFKHLHSEYVKLKALTSKKLTEKCDNTDIVMYDYERALDSKDDCIVNLKSKLEKLIDLLKTLDDNKKYKDNNMHSQYVQVNREIELEDKYQTLINDLNINHENTMIASKSKHEMDKETKDKYYRRNLSLLKDTYERDIKKIKKSNSESLKKIQSFHDEEIRALKQFNQEAKAKQSDSSFIEEKHRQEMEQLRINYDKMMKEKETVFIKEKEYLQGEIRKYIAEKECEIDKITKSNDDSIRNIKKKCKIHMRKLQSENNYALEQLRRECNTKTEVPSDDIYCRSSSEKVFEMSEGLKGDEDLFLEARTSTSGYEEGLYDSVMADERRFLLRRISLLEKQLAEKEQHSSENACDSEKRVWLERERCKEVSVLLDKEVERTEKLRSRLGEEKHRADHLSILNQALAKQVEALQHRLHQKDMAAYRILKSGELSDITSEATYDSDGSSLNPDFALLWETNFNICKDTPETNGQLL